MVLAPFFNETEPLPPNNVECWRRSLLRAKCQKPTRLSLRMPTMPANGHRGMDAKCAPWWWM